MDGLPRALTRTTFTRCAQVSDQAHQRPAASVNDREARQTWYLSYTDLNVLHTTTGLVRFPGTSNVSDPGGVLYLHRFRQTFRHWIDAPLIDMIIKGRCVELVFQSLSMYSASL